MMDLLSVVELLVLVSFGVACNLAAFAIWKYRIANHMHLETKGREYAGALPEHIWQTALGTLLVIVSAVWLILITDELTPVHFVLLAGFVMLCLGMQKLLNFENHRINTVTKKVRVTDDDVEEV